MFIAMALLILWMTAGQAHGEVENSTVTTKAGQLWGCHVPQLDAKVLGRETYIRRGREILVVRLDRNHDNDVDMIVTFGALGTSFSPVPIEYVYDTDFDGRPDKAYIDEMGNGICSQMREVDVKSVVGDTTAVPPATDGGQCEMDDPKNPKKEL